MGPVSVTTFDTLGLGRGLQEHLEDLRPVCVCMAWVIQLEAAQVLAVAVLLG